MQVKGLSIVLILIMGLMVVFVSGCVTPNNQTNQTGTNMSSTNHSTTVNATSDAKNATRINRFTDDTLGPSYHKGYNDGYNGAKDKNINSDYEMGYMDGSSDAADLDNWNNKYSDNTPNTQTVTNSTTS